MALFSRRKKTDPVPEAGIEPGEQPVEPQTDDGGDGAAVDPVPADSAAVDPVPADSAAEDPGTAASVGISVSTFQGLGGAGSRPAAAAAAEPSSPETAPASVPSTPAMLLPRRPGPVEAPPPTETVPGLRDNVLLRHALEILSTPPTASDLMNVARQLLQGHVFLRVQGDARELLSSGQPLPLAVARRGEKQYVLAYSGGVALQAAVKADGDLATSAAGQPVLAVLRHVLAGPFDGLILDNSSSPARAVLPRPVLQRAVDEADEALRIKTLLAAPRTPMTAVEVGAALADAPLWIAVRRSDEGGALGVAESRTPEGERYLEVFSHPLEALTLSRGDQPAPVTVAQLAAVLTRDPALTGVIVDTAGPSIRLSRDDLAPVLARASQS